MVPGALLAVAMCAQAEVRPAAPCRAEESGRSFATCFDPWTALELAFGGGVVGLVATPTASAALRLRGEEDSRSKESSTWLMLHRFGATELSVVGARLAVTALAWEGLFRRHVVEGTIVLSTNPPIQLPFPLDIGFLAEVGRYERRVSELSAWSLEVARLGVLFDPLRSGSGRFHLGVGPTLAYRLRSDGAAVTHELTPLTAGQLFFNFESDEGQWVLRGQALVGVTFAPPSTTGTLRARGELEVSRVLFAVNDQPVAVYLRGGGAWQDAGALGRTEWTASAGLQLRLSSAR